VCCLGYISRSARRTQRRSHRKFKNVSHPQRPHTDCSPFLPAASANACSCWWCQLPDRRMIFVILEIPEKHGKYTRQQWRLSPAESQDIGCATARMYSKGEVTVQCRSAFLRHRAGSCPMVFPQPLGVAVGIPPDLVASLTIARVNAVYRYVVRAVHLALRNN
jgi:hypothetical protein